MVIDLNAMKAILLAAAEDFFENEKALCLLDSDIGDGDHGVSMAKIGRILENHCRGDKTADSISGLFADIGQDVMGRVGGSSGMLWGAYFSGMGEGAEGLDAVDLNGLKKMFQYALLELKTISDAKIGDKTMMDAVIPATEAIVMADGELFEALDAAAAAAQKGAADTAGYIAKFGRAKNLKEGSLGFRDAGAVSAAMFFAAFSTAARTF